MKMKGSITVFMSIILSVLIAFSGVMVDLSRRQSAEKHARGAVQLSVQSALSQYLAPLKEDYGMMAMGLDQDELEALIGDLLIKNLAAENQYMPGYTDLYGFEVENVTVTPMFNLSEDYVLEQQITQFMKYRAPASTIGNFVEKLKSLNTCMAQSGLLNNKMELEKKLQKIREEQVYLQLLISERISGFTLGKNPGNDMKNKLDAIQQSCDEICQAESYEGQLNTAWNKIPDFTQKISETRSAINSLDSEKSELQQEHSSYKQQYSSLQSQIESVLKKTENLDKDIQRLEKDLSKEEEKKKPDADKIDLIKKKITSHQLSIHSYEDDMTALQSDQDDVSENISKTAQSIQSKESDISSLQGAVKNEIFALQEEINSCLAVLTSNREKMSMARDQISGIQSEAEKYIRYHQEALKLITESQRGCEEVQTLTAQINQEIADQTSKADNSFLTRMRADIQKLVLNADPTILSSIGNELNGNLTILSNIDAVALSAYEQITENLNSLDQFIEDTGKIPQTCTPFERVEFGTAVDKISKSLSEQITLNTQSYKNPEYSVQPAINQKEKNAFYRWCNKVLAENNVTDTSKDKGQQKKLKQNIKKKDNEEKEQQKAFNGSDDKLSSDELEELFLTLPSYRDDEGNYPNVVNSQAVPPSSQQASLLPETQEDENIDIEQSYSNSLNQNGSIAKIIGNAMANAGEAFLKSLYVNEFVVSAFKNANMDSDSRTMLLYTRQSGETFYEKAEAEYVLFGCKKEKVNANLAQTSIFGIRMGLNLIHVYTSTDKSASALTAATAIAGWTGFGVPVVKNLILVGWAAGESWMDVKDINNGKPVAVYKTKNTWKTNLKSLFSGVADEILKDSSQWLKQTTGDLITDADKALQDAVTDIVASAVHEAFLPLEETISDFGQAGEGTVEPGDAGFHLPGEINSMEDIQSWITDMARSQFEAIKNQSVEWTQVKVEEIKKKVQEKILEFIFKSEAYKGFVSKIRGGLNDLINSGTEQISDVIAKLGNKVGDTGTTSQLVGTVVNFDYADYLRLLLFVVPQKTKLLRCADLMQLNLRKTLDNPEFLMSDYHSCVVVEADISMRYMFVPKGFMDNRGHIRVRWGYGY